MLIICVQVVYSKNYTIIKKECHKHTNQKSENEQKRTVFSLAASQLQDATPYSDDAERVARRSLLCS